MPQLVIRNGTLVDGTGSPARRADVAIDDGRIVAIGADLPPGDAEIDAAGCIVAPGWVDVHTHYDAQATWDPFLTPSGWHGVTTVVMGNCGVGFAPARPDGHDWLIQLMEGVEDIPGAAMHEGIQWAWEHFDEYLDALAATPRAIDIAAQVPHAAVRAYVMGRRGAANEPATAEDIAAMAAIVRDGIKAGALGFSTSRTLIHKGSDGVHVPGTFAGQDELLGLAAGLAAGGGGVFQMTANHEDMAEELVWMRQIARDTGCTVSFNLHQTDVAPRLWRRMLSLLEETQAEGLPVYAQVAGRPPGILMCLEGTVVPLLNSVTYLGLHHLPHAEKLARLREPAVQAAILADEPLSIGPFEDFILRSFDRMYRLGDAPDYEPDPSTSAAAIAEARGCSPRQVVIEWLLEGEGRGVIYFPIFCYTDGDMEVSRQLLSHPGTVVGLADGGAHCGTICDVSTPTFLLTHWVRDRVRGARLSLEQVIAMQTRDSARLYGLTDRGVIAVGMKADLNVIDLDHLTLHAPEIVYDLPAGGRRFVQRAEGYRATVVSGAVVFRDGQPTGSLPGRLVRRQDLPGGAV
jgi:N-acyl-D-amino-acid deacylase